MRCNYCAYLAGESARAHGIEDADGLAYGQDNRMPTVVLQHPRLAYLNGHRLLLGV